MAKPITTLLRFFRVMISGRAYRNAVYLLAAFPLGVVYFVFLAIGVSAGVSLLIVWVGIPILLASAASWWGLASFERFLAVLWLKESIPPMARPRLSGRSLWMRLQDAAGQPVLWKSPLYLLLKFPLGVASFVILVALASLTLALLAAPLTYGGSSEFQIGLFLDPHSGGWLIDTLGEAMLCVLVGLILWPVTLHVVNALAWIHAKFARLMLSADPFQQSPANS